MYIHDVYPKKGGAMETTVFLSNRSQAVRLPKAVALPEDVKKVEIIAIGRTRIITPAGESWDSWDPAGQRLFPAGLSRLSV